MKNSINPEVMMRSLNSKLKTLLKHSLVLDNNEIEENLKKLLRKTLISEYLFENYVIAISGLQGVGKSTLLKQLYDIPEECLPIDFGRGEKLPILITEYNIDNIETRVKRFKKNEKDYYELKDEIIDTNEFKSIAQNPCNNDILLDLRIPLNKNIFNIENNKSFLLLPGIESKKNEWQELLEYSLDFSATCIFVFDHTKSALERNKKIIDKINNDFEKAKAKPIYVITFSDAVDDQNKELKSTFLEDFNIPKEEENRVICSGLKNEIGDEWISSLMSSIHKYSSVQREFRKSQFEALNKLLRYDLTDILTDIEKNGMYQDIFNEIKKMGISDFLKCFDEEEQRIRKIYSSLTSKSLENYISKPISEVEHLIINENKFQKFITLITGRSLKKQKEFKKNISDIWENTNTISPQDAQCLVLNELTSQRLQLHNQLPLAFEKHSRKQLLGNFSTNEEAPSQIINKDIINDYKTLFTLQNDNSELSLNHKKAIELMPVLATDFIRINTIYPELFANTETIPNEQMEEIIQDFSTQKKHYHTILAGIGGIIGVDGAVDGKIDTIPNLLKALGVTGAAASVAMWVGAGVATGFITISVIKQIYKIDYKDAYFAHSLLNAIKDKHYQVYMDNYDTLMAYIRELLKKRLTERYLINEADARNERIVKSLSDVKHIKDEMRELIYEYL